MIQLNLVNVSFGIQPQSDGSKLLAFVDEVSGIQIIAPLTPEAVKSLVAALTAVSVALGNAEDLEALRRAQDNGQP